MKQRSTLRAFVVTLVSATTCLLITPGAWPQSADLEALLRRVAAYRFGESREALSAAEAAIRDECNRNPAARKDIASALAEMLASKDATMDAKRFLVRQLAVIGGEESVPVLSRMLYDPATSDMARYALERIEGSAVDKAFRDALRNTSGPARIGIINSVGVRRDRGAVAALGRLLKGTDQRVGQAAAAALGKIGGPEVIHVLSLARGKARPEMRAAINDAYLSCADELLAAGQRGKALTIYKRLRGATSERIRIAGFNGQVRALGAEAVPVILQTLEGEDAEMAAVAAGCVSGLPGDEATEAFAKALPQLDIPVQIALLQALGERGDVRAESHVASMVNSADANVRMAALTALGRVGTGNSALMLARHAATSSGQERKLTRDTLARLRKNADPVILADVDVAEGNARAELVRALGSRRAKGAVDKLLATAEDANENVRVESYKALANVAEPRHVQSLIDLLLEEQSDTARAAAERAVAFTAARDRQGGASTRAVIAALRKARKNVPAKAALVRVLGKLGDDTALPPLRKAAKSRGKKRAPVREAAVRALSEWPTAAPMDDLRKIIRKSKNDTYRGLAYRGYVRMILLEEGTDVPERLQCYEEALSWARDDSERKLVIAGLAQLQDPRALAVLDPLLGDPALKEDAQVAIDKIKGKK